MNPWPKRVSWTALISTLLVMFFWALPSPQPDPVKSSNAFAIENVRIFDGETVFDKTTVVIEDGLIQAVGANVELPAGATVYDGAGKTLLPGLIDGHTHVWGSALSDAVRFGVTTEIDMFMDQIEASTIRERQRVGSKRDEASLVSAGTLVTTPGGHGTQYGLEIPTLSSAEGAEAFVATRITEGSDFIKIIHEDGALFGQDWDAFDPETLTAIVQAAHNHGKLAVVHATTLKRAREALEAGADALVHIFADQPADEAFVELAAKSGAFVSPTLAVIDGIGGDRSAVKLAQNPNLHDFLNPNQLRSLNQSFPPTTEDHSWAQTTVRALYAAGVPVLAGTDAPNPGTAHGFSMHHELELLVQAGLTPVESLAAATSVPADVFGLGDRGRIAPGMRADLLLVEGDPTEDITATRQIVTIWKDGREIHRTIGASISPDPVATLPVPAGIVSDFETGELTAEFGFGWVLSLDDRMGGSSTAEMEVLQEGGNHYLRIAGEIRAGAPFPWAGAMYFPAEEPMSPVDASAASGIAFRARGDGSPGRIIVFAHRLGEMPAITSFEVTEQWQQYEYPFSTFSGIDGSDLSGIVFSGPMVTGSFRLEIDDLELR